MPGSLPVSMPNGVSFSRTMHVLPGDGDLSFEVTAEPGSAALLALKENDAFPAGKIELADLSVRAAAERPLVLDGGKGKVTFSGKAGGYTRLAVLDEPGQVTALLVRDVINDDLARGLALTRVADHRFLMLRCGYDLAGAAKGALALGVGARATFGAEAKRHGAFAVVRQLPGETRSRDALQTLFDSWMLPSQFRQLDDIDPGTWIVAEVDGSFAMSLGAQYGFDFNWVRDAVQLGGLSGDIGLKIQLGVASTFGFEASGQYTIALSRPLPNPSQGESDRRIRLQMFRLDRKGLNVAFSAAASVRGTFGDLVPGRFDEFIKGVFGLHGLQVLKELDRWTSPEATISDLLAGVTVDYAEEFLGKVTGIDPKAEFKAARKRLVDLLQAWHDLPHQVTSTVYSLVEHEVSLLPDLRRHLSNVATKNLAEYQQDAEKLLQQVDFFRTPYGRWLEAAAFGPVLNAVTDSTAYGRVQQLAKQTLAILDGSVVESTLVKLQKELDQRLGLDKIEDIADKATFDRADAWLKARLSDFLGRKEKLDLGQAEQVRVAIHKLLALRQKFFDQARKALTKKYEFEVIGTYQKSTARTALVDVVFDFDATHAIPTQLNKLAVDAIAGDLDRILVQDIAGVLLRHGTLTHEITRQTHLEVTMPFRHAEMDHINRSLAKADAIDADTGRVLVYDLAADDLITARGKFSSRFSVNGRFARHTAVRVFDDQSMTHSYRFRQATPRMRRVALEAQLTSYVEAYFPDTFGRGEGSLATWITDLDQTLEQALHNGPDNFGNTMIALEVVAPAALAGAWAQAPRDEKDERYFRMSRTIQEQLRRLIPLVHFQDLTKFKDRIPSASLLVYSAIRPSSAVVVEHGRIEQFNTTRDVFWDIDSPGAVEAMARHSLTVAALAVKLADAHRLLINAHDMGDVAEDYAPTASRIERILHDALTTPNGSANLHNLLLVEREVVRDAHVAGMRIAEFIEAEKPAEALKKLAEFGASVTAAFNSDIGGLFSGRELRPLGTMVFLEAARTFAPDAAAVRPTAMLELTIVREKPSFDMGSFVGGAEIPAADVVRVEKFVSLA